MSKDNATENLRTELRSLADMFGEASNFSGDKSKEEMSKIRSKAKHALCESRHCLSETSDVIAKQTREVAVKAGNYVRENPWVGAGIGAAVGVVLDVLLSRR